MGIFLGALTSLNAQTENEERERSDSLYIDAFENTNNPDKVLHAEPLYIDLIRDLGARKGEKEWNVGMGLSDNGDYDKYTALIEYEWAPIDRLGLEVELPFSLFYATNGQKNAPGSRLNSLKCAAQYTFFVSEKRKTSVAFGYIHELEMTEFKSYGKSNVFTGNIYNPFLVAAKRFGNNFHTLLYTGPQWLNHFRNQTSEFHWQINSNVHYMISGTRNFVGIEFNKVIRDRDFDLVIRPQMKVGVAENFMVGIVAGIPASKRNERLSTFLRLIYEPGHKKGAHTPVNKERKMFI